jgi:DNA invertase Pin-like site-specific DNA recombinase
MCEGDTLVVRRLDDPARPIEQLIEMVEAPGENGIGCHALTEAVDTLASGGRSSVSSPRSPGSMPRGGVGRRWRK